MDSVKRELIQKQRDAKKAKLLETQIYESSTVGIVLPSSTKHLTDELIEA